MCVLSTRFSCRRRCGCVCARVYVCVCAARANFAQEPTRRRRSFAAADPQLILKCAVSVFRANLRRRQSSFVRHISFVRLHASPCDTDGPTSFARARECLCVCVCACVSVCASQSPPPSSCLSSGRSVARPPNNSLVRRLYNILAVYQPL